ncbi:alpha/beta fold hydrolase [Pseudooceanicola algae]|uniref:AB hydrolase-1 domain-containing protein n=1 Tax=Pseudooceanicola algae TaxID=1537215 RepID=A0A418SKU9_9RHOB|nr:alpha/beta hydrolase [Pseudooceanicola algae]QPM90962.1 hypothetical protein PSAL_022050 [Pseudooceanicola algae]
MLTRLISAIALLLCLGACSSLPGADKAGAFPLLENGKAKPGVARLIVVIPGAFESTDIFAPILDWDLPDTAVVAYRFPGMDGLPADHRVDIDGSARLIADYVNDIAPRDTYLVGFSTGGPIAIETAERLDHPARALALISSAAGAPSALLASARGAVDMAEAMLRSHSTDPQDTLTENYRTLLYGRDHYGDSAAAAKSETEAEGVRATMVRPSLRLTMAHSASLMTWVPDPDTDLAPARVGFFHGAGDPVFPLPATQRFAGQIHAQKVYTYPGQGHLLYETSSRVFDDIRRFFGL